MDRKGSSFWAEFFGCIGVLTLVVISLLGFFIPLVSITAQSARDTFILHFMEDATLAVRALIWIVIGSLMGLVLFWCGFGVLLLAKWVRKIKEVKPDPSTGLFPLLPASHEPMVNYNPESAQVASALAKGGFRPSAAVTKQLLNPSPPTPYPEVQVLEKPVDLPTLARVDDIPLLTDGRDPDFKLMIPFGVRPDGTPLVIPARNMGNGVLGGLQGYGKSELIAAIMRALWLQDDTGTRVQIGIIDMKGGVDFSPLPDAAKTMFLPAARTPEGALDVLEKLLREINRRNELFSRAKVPNIETYLQRTGEILPYIVFFIDEIMFLTLPATKMGGAALDKETRQAGQRFVQLMVKVSGIGRNSGVFVISATQKPSSTVIPTIIRDLAGWRVAFRCANVPSSIAVLSMPGAELLPDTPGRCLVQRSENPVLIQAYKGGIEDGLFEEHVARLPLRDPAPKELPEVVDAEVRDVTEEPLPPEALQDTTDLPSPPANFDRMKEPFTPEQDAYLYAIWKKRKRSLRATQLLAYPGASAGGRRAGWVKRAITRECGRVGDAPPP